jgi:MFS family permease
VVLKTIEKSDLVQAMSYLTVPAILGPVVGPPVGGFIVTYYSWRWIFFINVPIGIAGIFLVTAFIEDIKESDVPPLDFRGFLLTGLGLAGLVFGFESIGRGIIPAALTAAIMIGGGLCIILYIFHAGRHPNPIIDLALVRIPTFAASTWGGGMARMGIGALPFLLAMLLQLVFGLSPFASGMLTFASAAGALFMKITAGPIIRRMGFRSVLINNGILSGLILMSYALFRPTTPHILIIAALLCGGFFRSLQFTGLNALAYADVPQSLMSNASSLSSMLQQFFLSMGVAVAALILHFTIGAHHAVLNAHDFTPAFVVMGGLSIASVACFIPLEHHAGAEVSGRQAPVIVGKRIEAVAEVD